MNMHAPIDAAPPGRRFERLADFLVEAAARPFIYGECDCALMPADWCLAETGIDPAERLRGRYDSEAGWRDIAIRAGGLVELWSRLCGEYGLVETATPVTGDVGLVILRRIGMFGAVRGGPRWLVKLAAGIVGGAPMCVKSWRLPPCHKQ